MRISVKVHTKSSQQKVVKGFDEKYDVYLRQAPVDNKANKALVEILAEYFDIKKRGIRIVTGRASRNKIIEIDSNH